MRRSLLTAIVAVLLGLLLAGCGWDADDDRDAAETATQEAPDASPAEDEEPADEEPTEQDADEPEPPASERWEPTPNEVLVEVKRAAADTLVELLDREAGETAEDVAQRVSPDDPDLAARTARTLAPLLEPPDRAGAVRIRYPTMGGYGNGRAAVMVVAEHLVWSSPDEVEREVRVFDVRVRQEEGRWVFEDLASIGGEHVERPEDLSETAGAVLDHEGIELPDSARWDIHRGAVEEPVLEAMLALADRAPFRVTVFESGHPEHVFGTDRRSNHMRGRAVDIHGVGDEFVVEQREDGSELHELVRWLYEDVGVTELGSPWALDGPGGRSFTDEVHDDHLHIGFR
jgi:hypothetical protein